MQPPAGSQVSRVPAQRPPSDHLASPGPAPVPERPRRRLRTVLTVVAAVLTSLVLGGIVAGYLLYDRATTPDRSAPDVVVSEYLNAFLRERNDTRANLFTCDEAGVVELRALRDDLIAREQRFATNISVSWGSLQEDRQGDVAEVQVDLVLSVYVNGTSQGDRQTWSFTTRIGDEDWRVCSGRKVG
ncbi:hypothetical protein ACTMSW_28725 [Micromonospora sp. BQ11]|uniref:hypothetical protein n=1 Tax=Micromonospora sp. BQ11 TaxID=3452212 RepID=UPI003F896B10